MLVTMNKPNVRNPNSFNIYNDNKENIKTNIKPNITNKETLAFQRKIKLLELENSKLLESKKQLANVHSSEMGKLKDLYQLELETLSNNRYNKSTISLDSSTASIGSEYVESLMKEIETTCEIRMREALETIQLEHEQKIHNINDTHFKMQSAITERDTLIVNLRAYHADFEEMIKNLESQLLQQQQLVVLLQLQLQKPTQLDVPPLPIDTEETTCVKSITMANSSSTVHSDSTDWDSSLNNGNTILRENNNHQEDSIKEEMKLNVSTISGMSGDNTTINILSTAGANSTLRSVVNLLENKIKSSLHENVTLKEALSSSSSSSGIKCGSSNQLIPRHHPGTTCKLRPSKKDLLLSMTSKIEALEMKLEKILKKYQKQKGRETKIMNERNELRKQLKQQKKTMYN